MYTLRASNGSTSSEEIFWLMPAMRRNDRNGPGRTTPSVARETDLPAGVVLETRRLEDEELVVWAEELVWANPVGAQASRHVVPAKRTARGRRRNFIAY